MSSTVVSTVKEEFLTTILRNIEHRKGETIKIKNYATEGAASSGDNYTSSVIRVTVEYCVADADSDDGKVKNESFVTKVPHQSEVFMKTFVNLYKKEHSVYTDLLPKVYDLLQTVKYFSPRLLYSNSSYTLVFDDLKACGYVMADRYKLLDYVHCALCLKTLARFHAASVVLIEKHPDIVDHVAWEFLYSEEKKQWNRENLDAMSGIFVNTVESWNVFENFKARTDRFWETIVDEVTELCKPRKNSLNVVNHGDAWTNNMLFKYDDSGRPIDIKMIDFQVCRYTSPVMDILYLLFTSAGEDVLKTRLSELIAAYVGALNGQLEELGCAQRLTQQELESELRASYPFVFVIVDGVLPFIYTDRDTVIDFSNYGEQDFQLSNEDIYRKTFSAKNYKPVAIQVLRFLELTGIL